MLQFAYTSEPVLLVTLRLWWVSNVSPLGPTVTRDSAVVSQEGYPTRSVHTLRVPRFTTDQEEAIAPKAITPDELPWMVRQQERDLANLLMLYMCLC